MEQEKMIEDAKRKFCLQYGKMPEEIGFSYTLLRRRKWLFSKTRQVLFSRNEHQARVFDEVQSACERGIHLIPITTLLSLIVVVLAVYCVSHGYQATAVALIRCFCCFCFLMSLLCLYWAKKYTRMEKEYEGNLAVYFFHS